MRIRRFVAAAAMSLAMVIPLVAGLGGTASAGIGTRLAHDGHSSLVTPYKTIKVTLITVTPKGPVVTYATVKVPATGIRDVPGTLTSGCNSGQVNWVHTYTGLVTWELGEPQYCVGFQGITNMPYNATQWVCAGNNYGYFQYYDAYGTHTQDFKQGDVISFISTVRILHFNISGWSGGDECPQ